MFSCIKWDQVEKGINWKRKITITINSYLSIIKNSNSCNNRSYKTSTIINLVQDPSKQNWKSNFFIILYNFLKRNNKYTQHAHHKHTHSLNKYIYHTCTHTSMPISMFTHTCNCLTYSFAWLCWHACIHSHDTHITY